MRETKSSSDLGFFIGIFSPTTNRPTASPIIPPQHIIVPSFNLVKSHANCRTTVHGTFSTTRTLDCAIRCLKSYPTTIYFSYATGSSTDNCRCSAANAGNCDASLTQFASGWNVYAMSAGNLSSIDKCSSFYFCYFLFSVSTFDLNFFKNDAQCQSDKYKPYFTTNSAGDCAENCLQVHPSCRYMGGIICFCELSGTGNL